MPKGGPRDSRGLSVLMLNKKLTPIKSYSVSFFDPFFCKCWLEAYGVSGEHSSVLAPEDFVGVYVSWP